jgi:hypothetical protein
MKTQLRGPDGKLARLLIAYYGVVEVAHAIALARAGTRLMATGTIGFPAPPPPEGWSPQVIPFLVGTGVVDAINIVAAIAFVYGYFARARWRWGLGAVTLTVTAYSAVIFACGTIASGAWGHNLAEYLSLVIVFAPVAALTTLYAIWAVIGTLPAARYGPFQEEELCERQLPPLPSP